ncbi:MAG: glycosyltransferase family 87 protein [Bdellovibrionota bacterium]
MPEKRFWNDDRAQRFALTVLSAVSVSLAIVALTDSAGTSMVRRGDFPAFYSAAVLASRQQYEVLYDQVVQQLVQGEFWSSLSESYLAFPYPPFVALLLKPLAMLPPLWAKAVTGALMIGCVWLSVGFAGAFIPAFRKNRFVAFTAVLTFAPVFIGVFGGQNIALSMLLYVLGAYALVSDEHPREFLAGIAFGLWLFKPQLGGSAILFTALGCRLRFLAGAALPALGYYALAIPAFGFGWPWSWLAHAGDFSAIDSARNTFQMVSLASLEEHLEQFLTPDTAGVWVARATSVALGLLVAVFTAVPFLRARRERDRELRRWHLERGLLRVAPAVALLSPHTLFYDVGLCVFPIARYFDLRTDRRAAVFLLLTCAAMYFGVTRTNFSVTPLAAYVVGALMLCGSKAPLAEQ